MEQVTTTSEVQFQVICPYAADGSPCFFPSHDGPCDDGIRGRIAEVETLCKGKSAYCI